MKHGSIILLLTLVHAACYGQFQVSVGDASAAPINTLPPMLTTEGGLYTGRYQSGSVTLRHWFADGTVDWSKAVEVVGDEPSHSWTSVVLPPDNNLVIGRTGWTQSTAPPDNVDTTYFELHLANITASGSISASWTLQRRIIHGTTPTPDLDEIVPLAAPDGNIILVLGFSVTAVASTEVIKMTPQGQVLWARSVGMANDHTTDQPTSQSDPWPQTMDARCDSEGNTIISRTSWGEVLKLDKVSPDGALVWAREYNFLSVHHPQYLAIGIDADDRIIAGTSYVNQLGIPYGALLTVDPDGTCTSVEAIQGAFLGGIIYVGAAPNGDRFAANRTTLLKLDPEGQGTLTEQPLLQDGPWNYDVQRKDWDLRGEWLAYAGQIDRNNLSLGNHQFLETAATLDLTDPEHCALFGPTIQSTPFPSDAIPTGTLVNDISVALEEPVVHVSAGGGMQLSDIIDPSVADLCAVINSTEELSAALPDLVRATLLSAAEPIVIVHPDVLRTEVIDARGRVVHAGVFGASARAIATTGWEAGVYLVRGFCRQGRLLAVDRVVVQ